MKKFMKFGKAMLSIVLCITLIVCAVPMVSASDEKSYTRLADLDSLKSQFLVADETAQAEYPNGAMFFPVAAGELQMEELYAVDIFRQGGTAGEASITLKTIDLTASYGEHYRLYTSNKRLEPAVSGMANPYYAISNYSFIPTLTQKEVIYETDNASENTPKLRQDASEFNDSNLEYMPISGEVVINFADGETVKTIFIETLKSKTVTDDLEFMLTLSNPENCSISSTTTASFTIKENREKPATYIRVVDQEINPDSEMAYVQVQRAGNLGGFDDFRFKTQSSSAKAGESYEAVAMNLTFSPGMTEMKVPVTILEGAEDGQEFNVVISDTADDIILNDAEATVYLSSTAQVVAEAETGFSQQNLSSANGVIKSNTRGKEIVDLGQFQKSKNIGGSYNTSSGIDGAVLEYSNGWSCSNHAVSMVSKNKINVTGVDSITAWYDIYGGSCAWDYSAFYVGTSDKLSDNDGSCGWMSKLSGIGCSWDMTNISSSYLSKTATLDHSKVNGDQNIYLAMNKGAFGGSCGIHFYNKGASSEYNMLLNLTQYNIFVINPPTTQVMKGGKLVETTIAENAMISDPAVTSTSTTTKGTNFKIYRNESVAISSSMKTDHAKFKGVYICDPENNSKHSELIPLDSSVFTLTTDYLDKFSEYIKNKKIVIQPVYELSKSNLSVENYTNTSNGISFTTDNANCTGTATLNGDEIGTISWEKSLRDDGSYYVGDEIQFEFTPIDNNDEKVWSAVYVTRNADTEQLLQQAEKVTYDNDTGNNALNLNNAYYSVTPEFTYKNATTKLIVTNPTYGDFYGKDGDFATDEDNGNQIVTGYRNTSGDNILFKNFGISSVISFNATPDSGYRAKWTYRDAASHQQKVYYGNTFHYAVQNPYYEDDNNVTLTFEKRPDTVYTKYISGSTYVQQGSVLNPPINDTAIYDIAPNTLLTMDIYTDMSDGNGNFSLKVDPNAETPELAQITFSADETHRVLAYRNDQYYICDVNMADYANATDTNAHIEVKLPYKTYGVTPKHITAIDADNNTYNDAITLITAKSFRFDLEFSRTGEAKDRPVNMVRWTVESEYGVEQTFDVKIEETDLTCHWANVISEIINPGEKLMVELFHVKYDKDNKPIEYNGYGKYDTGYTFIASSIEESITYMPEIGVESEATKGYTYDESSAVATPIPCIGPISPTVSIKGFTPIINMSSTGEQDEEGHDLHSVTIGVQFGKLKNVAQKDSKWSSMGPYDKAEKLGNILGELDEINNSKEGFKAFGGGTALKMKTAVNVSFSITFCFQGNYYVDAETGEWRFVDSIFIIGTGGTVRVSVPFVVLYIPCFVFFTFEGKFTAGIRTFPNETNEASYLTLNQLASKKYSDFQGNYAANIKVGLGLGVGFDGLLNAQGSLTATFDFQFNDYLTGFGNFGLNGTVALELLFLKASWTGNIISAELFNTLNSKDIQSQMLSAVNDAINEEDILKNLTVGDLVVNKAQKHQKNDNLRDAIQHNEKVLESTTAVVEPAIAKISDGIYLIVSEMNCGDEENSVLHYYIYNSNTEQITESGEVLRKLVSDMQSNDAGVNTDYITGVIDTIDHDVKIIDCGDDILIMWNKSMCTSKDTNGYELLNSINIASVFYNKTTGEFHGYNRVKPPENTINFLPKAAYNENTGIIQLFYQKMDLSDITADSTLEEVTNTPTKLMTTYCNINDENYNWSTPTEVTHNNKMLQYYDVISYGDNIMLSYVSSDTAGFVLEDFDAEDYSEEHFNKEHFGTENYLYIQQFSVDSNNALVADKHIQIADENYVVANPEFVNVKTEDVDNTLLFFKCDGKYAYQNINTLLTQAVYTDSNGNLNITEDYMEPTFVTHEEDHTVNDDYTIYFNDDGTIYSLWTTTEGEQQQIWARHFYIEDVTTVTETPELDENGTVVYDENGNPIMTPLSEPVKLLHGTWGTKNYLTEGGVGGSTDVGMFKSNFAAAVLDNGDILTAYNSCDYEYSQDTATMINNQFVVAEYDPSADYQLPDKAEHLEFSDEYPNPGETVTVTMNAKNEGIKTGDKVQFTLYVNGEEYATKTVDKWFADEQQLISVQYTLPENMEADDVSFYYTISENGTVKATSDTYTFEKDSKIIMTNAKIMPIQNVTDKNPNAKFYVTVDVYNTGNVDYAGGDVLKFVDYDLKAEFTAIDPDEECTGSIYTSLGSCTLPGIAKSKKVTMKFVSDEVPKSVFEKNGDAANLEFVISQADKAGWTTIEEDDEYGFIDEFNIGYTQTPKQRSIKALELSDITVTEGNSAHVSCGATPTNSLIGADVQFISADESIATVNRFGVVTGVSTGTTTITVTANGVEATATVTVKTANPVLGDVNSDGEVTIKDATLLQTYIAKLCTEDELNLSVADVNGDGSINIVDVTNIQLIVAKYIIA